MPAFGNDPRAFIRHNLFTLHSALDNPAPALVRLDGTVLVKLVDITSQFQNGVQRNRNRRGLARLIPTSNRTWWNKPATIYEVTPANAGDGGEFAAYICPYEDNAVHTKYLGSDADVMFTGDMDGCTFGIGIPNGGGGVRVAHANARNMAGGSQWAPDFAPQRVNQTLKLQSVQASTHTLQPRTYRDNAPRGSEFKAVTIGLRIGKKWEFYYQHHHVDGMDYRNKLATTKIN